MVRLLRRPADVELKELLWTEGDLVAVTHGRGLWHHARYSETWIPPRAHTPDIRWLIELSLAIHGGDPAPEVIRQQLGRRPTPWYGQPENAVGGRSSRVPEEI